jgi:hydrogenase nickel incorporation protein HypA/HybF
VHELAITQSIFIQAIAEAKKHKAKHIKKIKLQVGEASAIVPECVQFYFNTLKKGTIAENGVLEFEVVPLKLRCPKCKKEVIVPHMSLQGSNTTEVISELEIATPSARNDNLGYYEITCDCKKGVEIISGQEMIIEYIDVE